MTKRIIFSERLFAILKDYGMNKVELQGKEYTMTFKNFKRQSSDNDLLFEVETSTEFNYFDFNKKSKITYIDTANNEQQFSDSGKWKLANRQELKVGKFVKLWEYKITEKGKFTSKAIQEKVLNKFTELLGANIKSRQADLDFAISSSVASIYHLYTAEGDNGHLDSSCMRPESEYGCKDHTEAYDLIPDLRVIYGTKEQELQYRALLWQTVTEDGKSVVFMDRVYSNESVRASLISYAKEKGYAHRNESGKIIYKGAEINLVAKASDQFINHVESEGAPYMDTFTCLNITDKTLSNTGYSDHELQNTNGNGEACYDCGDTVHEDERYYGGDETLCSSCYHESWFYCDECGYDCHQDERASGLDCICENCARKTGYMQCYDCGSWSKEYVLCDDDAYCFDNGCADNYTHCESCDETIPCDDAKQVDGCNYCTDCGDQKEKELEEEQENETA